MTGSDGIAPADHRPLPRAATWCFMTELRRRARGPPVDSRDDHSTVVAGLDRTARPTKITTVRSQTSRPASHGHLAMTCMIAITGLDDFLQTESAITITGICKNDLSPRLAQRAGDRLPYSARGSRHQRNFAIQSEAIEDHVSHPSARNGPAPRVAGLADLLQTDDVRDAGSLAHCDTGHGGGGLGSTVGPVGCLDAFVSPGCSAEDARRPNKRGTGVARSEALVRHPEAGGKFASPPGRPGFNSSDPGWSPPWTPRGGTPAGSSRSGRESGARNGLGW